MSKRKFEELELEDDFSMLKICREFKQSLLLSSISKETTLDFINKLIYFWFYENKTNENDESLEKFHYQLIIWFEDKTISKLEIDEIEAVYTIWTGMVFLLQSNLDSKENSDEYMMCHKLMHFFYAGFQYIKQIKTFYRLQDPLLPLDLHTMNKIQIETLGFHYDNEETNYTIFLRFLLKRIQENRFTRHYTSLFEEYRYENKMTYSWIYKDDVDIWIRKQCNPSDLTGFLLGNTPSTNIKQSIDYISNLNCPVTLPVLKRDRTVFSFKNGLYFLKFDLFIPFESNPTIYYPNTNQIPVACNFIPLDFNPYPDFTGESAMQIETKEIDKILNHQEFSRHTQEIFWVLLGRCLYDAGTEFIFENNEIISERWQVAICYYGLRGTGKSQLINIFRHIYQEKDIGIISNEMRKIQGFENLDQKYIILGSDIKSGFWMNRADWQILVENGILNIQGMYKAARPFHFKMHSVWAFNENPYPDDPQGAVSRRQALFKFVKGVEKQNIDNAMELKIADNIHNIILKANRMYIYYIKKYANNDFWNIASAQMWDNRNNMDADTNTWVKFLKSDSVILDPNLYCPIDTLFKSYKEYVKILGQNQQRSSGIEESKYLSAFNDLKLKCDLVPQANLYLYPLDEYLHYHPPGTIQRFLRYNARIVRGVEVVIQSVGRSDNDLHPQ